MPKKDTDTADAELADNYHEADLPDGLDSDENVPGEGHPANKYYDLHKIAVQVDRAGQVMNFLGRLAHNGGDSGKAAGMVADAETLQRVARMFQAIADQQPRKPGSLPSDGDDYNPDDDDVVNPDETPGA